jgi:hypothetical protein
MIVIHQTDECTEALDRSLELQMWLWLSAFTAIDAWFIGWLLS